MPDDTTNHGYRRPDRGSEDWNVPINENFARIDTGVEIRDVADNRGEYEPKQGSKFLATDSGRVHVGDGDEWQRVGTLVDEEAIRSPADGAEVARPGEIQSVINSLATDTEFAQVPTQTVRLLSGRTYEIEDTVEVKPNIRLECNGARIVPTGNFNLFELHRGTQLVSPFCDTRDVNWNATQVVIGPEGVNKIGTPNRAWVRDAYLLGTDGEGIGLQFRGGDSPCSMQQATGSISGFDRAIDIYAAGEDTDESGAWANGNRFYGEIEDFRVGISMRSEGAAVDGNFIRVQAQPSDGVSEWLWKMDPDPRADRDGNRYIMNGNNVVVQPWDTHNYENNNPVYESGDRRAPVWFIGRGSRYGNSLWDLSGTLSNEFVVNNSDTAKRNGVFTSHGGFVTGTSQFRSRPVYEPNSGVAWHRASTNARQDEP
jgi:hypothetical protein